MSRKQGSNTPPHADGGRNVVAEHRGNHGCSGLSGNRITILQHEKATSFLTHDASGLQFKMVNVQRGNAM